MVNSVTVTFGTAVTLDPGAIEVTGPGGPVGVSVATSVVGGRTVAVVTFTGPGVVGGSLADGNYTLTVRAAKVRDALGRPLDGNGDGTAGDDRSVTFFRLFGDSDGDRDVDAADLDASRAAFHTSRGGPGYLWYLDFDGDGTIGSADHREIQRRRGSFLSP
jgi:hypothetical protein